MVGKYSIKDLEKLTGIKAHTLRIWEQRYNIIVPKRTETNIRYYDNSDLKRLLNISFLNKKGVKISKIANLSNDEVCQKVLELSQEGSGFSNFINILVLALVDMDEEQFEKILSTCILKFGFEKSVIEIIYPFLKQIGIMWQAGSISPAQEHFMSNLIRQKIIVALDSYPNPNHPGVKKFLLFCPEGEIHEISLLFSAYLIKSSGNRIVYLGASVPYEDLELVYQLHKPDCLVVSISTKPDKSSLQEYINKVCNTFKEECVFFTGYIFESESPDMPENGKVLRNINDFKDILAQK